MQILQHLNIQLHVLIVFFFLHFLNFVEKVSEGRQDCGCLSITWPDDSLQKCHPASQKLKVCLQVLEHLQANVLSESSDRGTVRLWENPFESWGCLRLLPTICLSSEVEGAPPLPALTPA